MKAVKRARAESDDAARMLLEKTTVQLDRTEQVIDIRTAAPKKQGRNRNVSVAYTVTVPKEIDLELKTANGHVDVDDVSGAVDAKTTNGRIDLKRITGSIQAKTTNGKIGLLEVLGPINAKTANGSIKAEVGGSGEQQHEIRAATTNGGIEVTLPTGAGNPALSYILLGIAFLVLTIACVNFITLAVGRSFSRDREVAMRKVTGASRKQLVTQFLGESMALSVLALVAGVCVAELFLPVFNSAVVKDLSLGDEADGAGVAFLIGLAVTVGLAAGGYPAFVLSAAQPAVALKGRSNHGETNRFGRTLVVLEFALSIFLVVSALVMVRQVEYLRTKPLGFDSEYLVSIHAIDPRRPDLQLHEVYRNELIRHHLIQGVTTTGHMLSNRTQHHDIVEYEVENYIEMTVGTVIASYSQEVGRIR